MTRGELFKRFLNDKGWINNDVIRGKGGETVKITINSCAEAGKTGGATFDEVLIMGDYELLCGELATGSVVFHWDDIAHVKIEHASKKKGWF